MHVGVNRAEYVAIHPEASNLVCDEGDGMLMSWGIAEASVIVVDYCESMHFTAVIVDDRDDHRVALMHSNDRPLRPKRFVIAPVHSRKRIRWISLDNREMKHLTGRGWLRRIAVEETRVEERDQ